MEKPTQVFVLSGPTAVGKGTVLKELLRVAPHLWYSISATTRPPRPGEVDGVNYYFVSNEEFDRLVESGDMLEWAVVHGVNRYGTPRQPVLDAIASGETAILELDLAGARQVRQSMPEAMQIFLAPPSWKELVNRLHGRGTETPEDQARRLESAKVELAAEEEFDAVVINETVSQATEEILHIIEDNR